MTLITKHHIQSAVYWVEIPEVELKILCGCPVDSIKHLRERGFLHTVEHDGVTYESGPNAILLSDVLLQNGALSNMTEFPVLQMLYNQGMVIPGHPNNSGLKPILIGDPQQVAAQMEYIFRGNYGLISEEEYLKVGIPSDEAKKNLNIKLYFAYGSFLSSDKLVDQILVESEPATIRSGVTIRRIQKNVFEISYKGESVTVDLTLKPDELYRPTYELPPQQLKNPYFSVIHTGEGNGWDPTRPCLGSVIQFDGKIYLIDAGPQIDMTLKALGVGIDQIDGIYFTHIHDDHFAGLFKLMNEKKKQKIFATDRIYSTLLKKLSALLSKTEEEMTTWFEFIPLIEDQWHNNQGLEVISYLSPHSVDTTIFIFRAMGDDGYKTYGHFADIAAISYLKEMVTEDQNEPGLSNDLYQKLLEIYRLKLNIKKVDVGGPTIHGEAEDFIGDPSDRLVLSHTTYPLTKEQLEIGEQAQFGEVDVLIEKAPK